MGPQDGSHNPTVKKSVLCIPPRYAIFSLMCTTSLYCVFLCNLARCNFPNQYLTNIVGFKNSFPTFQVVHVVETGRYGEKGKPTSYISLFSTTPGRLTKEAEKIEGLTCGKTNVIDFVTFSVKYSCWTFDETGSGWGESDIPIIHVKNNVVENNQRITEVSIDTKVSTRWSLAINTKEIEDFELRGNYNSCKLKFFFYFVSNEFSVFTEV